MNRLNQSVLDKLPVLVVKPTYNRESLLPGIVHLGVGAFHRAHQAFFTEAVLNKCGGDWGIVGCSLRSGDVRDQMKLQDCFYTLVEKVDEKESFQLVGAISDILVGPEEHQRVIEMMASDNIKIISLTITERGYCHDSQTGSIDFSLDEIAHDLKNLATPVSAIGYLVAALQLRHERGSKGVTLLSCDNLVGNGKVLKQVVLDFSRSLNPDLSDWILEHVTFPCSMVDRIVPATTAEDRNRLENILGVRDEAAVICENYCNWVIEDDFACGRPRWEEVGVHFVQDISPFEAMKLHLLNGAHSIMAYAGILSGFKYTHEVIAHPAFFNLINIYMDAEVSKSLDIPSSFDFHHYKSQLIERFQNTGIEHSLAQIAANGSLKLPQRWFPTLRFLINAESSINVLCFGIAAWILYINNIYEKGDLTQKSDAYSFDIARLCSDHKDDARAMVQAAVEFVPVFGTDLKDSSAFLEKTTEWLNCFYTDGVIKALNNNFCAS